VGAIVYFFDAFRLHLDAGRFATNLVEARATIWSICSAVTVAFGYAAMACGMSIERRFFRANSLNLIAFDRSARRSGATARAGNSSFVYDAKQVEENRIAARLGERFLHRIGDTAGLSLAMLCASAYCAAAFAGGY